LRLFSIDIDGFKDINDLYGHGAGDLLLIDVAERMRKQLLSGEFLARQSGDEFLALTTSPNHPHDAHAFAERISQSLPRRSWCRLCRQPDCLRSASRSSRPIRPERDQLLSNAKACYAPGQSTQGGSICAYSREMDDSAASPRARPRS